MEVGSACFRQGGLLIDEAESVNVPVLFGDRVQGGPGCLHR